MLDLERNFQTLEVGHHGYGYPESFDSSNHGKLGLERGSGNLDDFDHRKLGFVMSFDLGFLRKQLMEVENFSM